MEQYNLEDRIIEFINEHHLLSVAATNGDDLWSASAFYAFNKKNISFIITSDTNTKHIQLALTSNIVSGIIALETETIGMIRGVQFKANILKCSDSLLDKNRLLYLKRFPYAVLKGGDLWELVITELKFTDNRLGFGKKLFWTRIS